MLLINLLKIVRVFFAIVVWNNIDSCLAAPRLLITLDDFPHQYQSELYDEDGINEMILRQFRRFRVHAIVFVNADRVMVNPDYYQEMLLEWLRFGHELGNHTFSHLCLSKTDVFTYKLDIINGEPILKKVLSKFGKRLRYFRYPYLDRGSGKTKEEIEKFLANRDYEVMYITIDTSDWKYNRALHKELAAKGICHHAFAKGSCRSNNGTKANCDEELCDEMTDTEREYIEHVKLILKKNFNKRKTEIILFHANLINAHCIAFIIKYAKKIGYKIV